jgi:c-di-GMP-related signal transduction protein
MDREDIRLGIRNIKNLPTLPVIVSRVLEVADDSGSSANELADIVSKDMSVSAKVLNLANSAFYGFSRRITTIPQAVVVLGFDTVRSFALSVSVFETLKQTTDDVSFDREAFWIYSIGCGTSARLIAKNLNYKDTGTFFVAGLLHDLGKVLDVLDPLATNKGIDVVQELPDNFPIVEADEGRIRQILFNLLSNAIKFTSETGKVSVVVELLDNGFVQVQVRDTGIGIKKEHQDIIFSEFRQVDETYARRYEGTGLGLALTKRLVELHEGTIWVESVEGEGSTFTFTFPHRRS